MRHRKPAHGHATDGFDARRKRIGPRDVVLRAGGEYLDLGVTRQMLSDVARMQLGAAVDVGAVPLCDDRNLHDASEPESDGGSTLAGWGVAVAADGSTTRCSGSDLSARGSTLADSDVALAGDGSTPGACRSARRSSLAASSSFAARRSSLVVRSSLAGPRSSFVARRSSLPGRPSSLVLRPSSWFSAKPGPLRRPRRRRRRRDRRLSPPVIGSTPDGATPSEAPALGAAPP